MLAVTPTSEWVDPSELALPFHVYRWDPRVYARTIRIDWESDGAVHHLEGYDFLMPNWQCKLTWFPWPSHVPLPILEGGACYHKVRQPGKGGYVDQPRRTRCYEHSYKYSGRWHPVEPTTPLSIKRILDETTAMYDAYDTREYGTPMCLENEYTTRRHNIAAHPDATDQMGTLTDVICWVTGAVRKLTLDTNVPKGQKNEIVLEVDIAEGIYIMRGRRFQEDYRHGIKDENAAMFDRLRAIYPPKDITDAVKQADWLAANANIVRPQLSAKDAETFDYWLESRTSYTVRFFREGHGPKK